jgi:hypothetical protein
VPLVTADIADFEGFWELGRLTSLDVTNDRSGGDEMLFPEKVLAGIELLGVLSSLDRNAGVGAHDAREEGDCDNFV